MSKRKFGFEGFVVNRQATYNFDRSQPSERLYVPPSARGSGGDDDGDLDNIDYAEDRDEPDYAVTDGKNGFSAAEEDDIDPLDAFMEGLQEEMKAAPPPKTKEKLDKYRDDVEDDPMESFLSSKKDLGLQLAADALHAGYNSDEEVYAAAKAVDSGMVEYDSDDNPIIVDKKKIEPIPELDHSSIDYEPFNKDFYEEKASISGTSELDATEYKKSLAIRVSGFDVPRPIKTFEDCGFSLELMKAIAKQAYEKPTPIQCQALPVMLSGRDMIGVAKTGSGNVQTRPGRAGDKDGTAYTLVTQKEARFAGELINSLIAAGQNVSMELMDLAMNDGRFNPNVMRGKEVVKELKEGVVVVEVFVAWIMVWVSGIGYNPESNTTSNAAPNRPAAVNSQRTGMMAQFKNNFVPASSNSSSQFAQAIKRTVLPGFVSGGTIGADMHAAKINSPVATAPASGNMQDARGTANIKHSERDKTRDRRRPSGWDH